MYIVRGKITLSALLNEFAEYCRDCQGGSPNQRRTCWSIAPMVQMPLIRCILGVKSSRSMIFMGILWEV